MACENCECEKCEAVRGMFRLPDADRYKNGNWSPVTEEEEEE